MKTFTFLQRMAIHNIQLLQYIRGLACSIEQDDKRERDREVMLVKRNIDCYIEELGKFYHELPCEQDPDGNNETAG
jgi:hypothetical protein